EAGVDHLAGVGMRPDLSRQGEELQGRFEVDLRGAHALRHRHALRLFALSELDVEPPRTFAHRDLLARRRVLAEHARPCRELGLGGMAVRALDREPPRVTAFGVIGASDEGAELAELQRQAAGAAAGAEPRVLAAAVVREEMAAELLVELLDD